jgi:ubiquitin-conjugating enzyme E2 D/E
LLDSFVVGTKASGLKSITLASGGKCYFPETLDYGLQLFEDETILSAGFREVINVP